MSLEGKRGGLLDLRLRDSWVWFVEELFVFFDDFLHFVLGDGLDGDPRGRSGVGSHLHRLFPANCVPLFDVEIDGLALLLVGSAGMVLI
jgi:hypothetical protein